MMMKKIWIIATCSAVVLVMAACGGPRRNPGRVYMPDMAYSRAYETYASTDKLKEKYPTIHYTSMPVAGTVARGDMAFFSIPKDNGSDTANYYASRAVASPITNLSAAEMKEAERLYLINCGICHGTKLDGNGPLWNDGKGAFPAAPKNLIADPVIAKMPAGQMFYSLTYGKNTMGSYASQLSTKQRWEVIAYIQMKQGAGATKDTAAKAAAAIPVKDTAAKKVMP